MTPRLFLRAAAKADLREAFDWYEERSTGLGFEFLRAARAALALIERHPTQFAIVLDDIRRAQLLRFPYAVYVATYGVTRTDAVAKVQALGLRVLAERLERGEAVPELLTVTFHAA